MHVRTTVAFRRDALHWRPCASCVFVIAFPELVAHIWQWAAMSSTSPTPVYYVIFCAVAVTVLKAVNEEVTEPYMVRCCVISARRCAEDAEYRRTSLSMSRRRRRTVRETTGPGTQRSPLLPVCTLAYILLSECRG